jgi:hypothetical protein
MRTALIVLALLAAPAFAAQTVWKWVDDKGVTHYSDQPVPGAQRIEVSSGSRSDPVDRPAYSPQRSPNPQQTGDAYRTFEILAPSNQETFANTGGSVGVRLRFEPELHAGHSLHLYLDGKLVEEFPPIARDYTLQGVSRGTHVLTAIIQDSRGARIQTSEVTFHVRQESVARPPVGPTLRPPPRPNR